MKIRVLLFASLAHDVGRGGLEMHLSDNATVGDALAALARDYPPISRYRTRLATAVNLDYVGPDHCLCDGDELAVIPPVSGG
jgi:molybdopterin converting factor small subunit